MMKTFEFKSERNWNKAYDYLVLLMYDRPDDKAVEYTCYCRNCITVFNEYTEQKLIEFCKTHRIAIKEIAE